MKVSEAIDQLEIGDTVWAKATVNAINFEGGYIRAENTKTSIYLDGNAEISLEEPQAEKVEVKEEQAELLKRCEGESIYYLLGECTEEEEELLVKARLFGYTVKSKRWVVRLDNGRYVNDFQEAKFCIGIGITLEMDCLPPFKFTDRAKAEAVATLVEGSVEEV
jgi:hypothetical protein